MKKQILAVVVFVLSTLFSNSAFPWASLYTLNTHGTVLAAAYEILSRDKALANTPFPSLALMQANEGVYVAGDGNRFHLSAFSNQS